MESVATGYFLINGPTAVNILPILHPIKMILTNGKVIMSTHTSHIDISWLSEVITKVYIVPRLAHLSLISTRNFCNAGCNVMFDKQMIQNTTRAS